MARRLKNWSRLEVRAMVRFLWAKNVTTSDIQSRIMKVYGEAMRRKHVAKWCLSFQSGRQNRNCCDGSGGKSRVILPYSPDLAPNTISCFRG
ncbi:hypothetical protein TNCV_2900681 [Trichonephila clavipes]|nr:hypothetical protein TNCV_2900681 [Trichonephila clavipes]